MRYPAGIQRWTAAGKEKRQRLRQNRMQETEPTVEHSEETRLFCEGRWQKLSSRFPGTFQAGQQAVLGPD